MTVNLGDFNAKFNNWSKADITSLEGPKIDTITSSYGLNQLIQEPTLILNLSSFFIDLIFTSQPNLVVESGIVSSFHQIVLARFNLSIFYAPPCERTVWLYETANTELITRAIDQFLVKMMMKMVMNCFCGMVDQRKVFSLISSRNQCQKSKPLRISDTPRAGFELAQNLSSGLVE